MLLVLVLGAPSASRADCQHPVDRPSIALAIDGFRAEPSADRSTPSKPKPCDGPQCSGKSAPPMSPAPQVPPRLEQWGLADSPPPVALAGPSAAADSAPLVRPISLASSIFHPPRLPR